MESNFLNATHSECKRNILYARYNTNRIANSIVVYTAVYD